MEGLFFISVKSASRESLYVAFSWIKEHHFCVFFFCSKASIWYSAFFFAFLLMTQQFGFVFLKTKHKPVEKTDMMFSD